MYLQIVPSKQKNVNKNNYFFGDNWPKEHGKNPQLDRGPDPDPFVRGMDPRIRIRTKMSRIRNTAIERHLISKICCFRLLRANNTYSGGYTLSKIH
jgi:hypothetical protein